MQPCTLPLPAGYAPEGAPSVALLAAELDEQLRVLEKRLAGADVAALEWQLRPGVNTTGMLLAPRGRRSLLVPCGPPGEDGARRRGRRPPGLAARLDARRLPGAPRPRPRCHPRHPPHLERRRSRAHRGARGRPALPRLDRLPRHRPLRSPRRPDLPAALAARDGVMARFPCPYLGGEVEWTTEREQHVSEQHPDLLPDHRDKVSQTLLDPDEVRRSLRFGGARLFSRWYADVREGKHVVVVVVSDRAENVRYWVITAYITRRLAQGDIEWSRS